ncbi:MAG: DcrB-related protein [Xanthomonadaceae bacterium]|jgi:hypothetical protein|nr:DcrB-related protein [Xanthomonadaceae bacterium]
MSLFHFHEGLFDLPDGWRDQTMNVLRLAGQSGQKDSAILVTRDSETSLDTPGDYADAQQEAASKNFPGYRSLARNAIEIDGQPAVVVDYQWRSNGSILLRQRQAYVRHRDVMLILTLSAQANQFEALEPAWEQILASLKLLERKTEAASSGPEWLPHVFALSTQNRILKVYPDSQTACARLDPLDVENQQWVFFASDGSPLKATFTVPNRRRWFRALRGRFELQPDHGGVALNLRGRLHDGDRVQGVAPLETFEAIQAHLNRVAVSPSGPSTGQEKAS